MGLLRSSQAGHYRSIQKPSRNWRTSSPAPTSGSRCLEGAQRNEPCQKDDRRQVGPHTKYSTLTQKQRAQCGKPQPLVPQSNRNRIQTRCKRHSLRVSIYTQCWRPRKTANHGPQLHSVDPRFGRTIGRRRVSRNCMRLVLCLAALTSL